MWIRSQDKANLINAKRLEIVIVQGSFHRIICPDYEEYVELGVYSSKEKAVKVLDEIQECLLKHMKGLKFSPDPLHKINFIFTESFVYQMPKYEDVEV